MTLVDSSVWVDFFNGRDTPEVARLEILLKKKQATLNELIYFEITCGIKSDSAFNRISTYLREIGVLDMKMNVLGPVAITYYRQLRKKGVTIRKSVDVFIASQCILHEIPLLHNDRDFAPFEELGLKSV